MDLCLYCGLGCFVGLGLPEFLGFLGLVVVSPRLGFGGDLDGLAFYCLGLVGG